MKQWRDPTSPYGQKLYFEDHEFEAMMANARRQAGSDVFVPGKGIDVDLVLLRVFNLEADYVDLGPTFLGRTLFDPSGAVGIQVSRSLGERAKVSAVARRRLRTTLAHEVGHVVCHSILFTQDATFPDSGWFESAERQLDVLCRQGTVESLDHQVNWLEYQANQCMASLLLPRQLFASYVGECLFKLSLDSVETAILQDRGREVWRWLSRVFDVNERAIHYRLQNLGFVTDGVQPSLSRQG